MTHEPRRTHGPQMRFFPLLVAFVACSLLLGCPSEEAAPTRDGAAQDSEAESTLGDADDNGASDVTDGDANGEERPVLTIPDIDLEGFAVWFEVDRNMALVGQEVTFFDAQVVDNESEVTFSWNFAGGTVVRTEDGAQVVTFPEEAIYVVTLVGTDAEGGVAGYQVALTIYEPGPHYVGDINDDQSVSDLDRTLLVDFIEGRGYLDENEFVRADLNLDGSVSGEDLTILESAISADENCPIWLSPSEAVRGTLLLLAHPGLLDPGTDIAIEIEGEAAPTIRGGVGFVYFAVPFSFEEAQLAEIVLFVDEEPVHTETLSILAAPQLEAATGLVPDTLDNVREALELAEPLLQLYVTSLDVPEEYQEFLLYVYDAGLGGLSVIDQFDTALDTLSSEQQRLYELVALANGFDEFNDASRVLAEELRAIVEEVQQKDGHSDDEIVREICLLKRVVRISKAVQELTKSVNVAVSVINASGLSYVLPGGSTLIGLGKLTTGLLKVLKFIETVGEFVPEIGNQVSIRFSGDLTGRPSDPPTVRVHHSVTVNPTVDLHVAGMLCSALLKTAVDLLKDGLIELITNKAESSVTGYREGVNEFNIRWDYEELPDLWTKEVKKAVENVIDYILGVFDPILDSVTAVICDKLKLDALSPDVTLDCNTALATPQCNRCTGENVWMCTPECASQNNMFLIRPGAEVCGRVLVGQPAPLLCEGCTRDNCENRCCTRLHECVEMSDPEADRCRNAGFTVTPRDNLETDENGGAVTLSVRINTEPLQLVTLAVSLSDETEGIIYPAIDLIRFGPDDQEPKEIRIEGMNDGVLDGDTGYQLRFQPSESNDGAYNDVQIPPVTITNEEEAGISVTPATLLVDEGGSTATFTVRLERLTTEQVRVPVRSSDEGEGRLSVNEVVFQPGEVTNEVTVTGQPDGVPDGDQEFQVRLLPVDSPDPAYNDLDPPDVTVTNTRTVCEGSICPDGDTVDSMCLECGGEKTCQPHDSLCCGGTAAPPDSHCCPAPAEDSSCPNEFTGESIQCLVCDGEAICAVSGYECCGSQAVEAGSCCESGASLPLVGGREGTLACGGDTECAQSNGVHFCRPQNHQVCGLDSDQPDWTCPSTQYCTQCGDLNSCETEESECCNVHSETVCPEGTCRDDGGCSGSGGSCGADEERVLCAGEWQCAPIGADCCEDRSGHGSRQICPEGNVCLETINDPSTTNSWGDDPVVGYRCAPAGSTPCSWMHCPPGVACQRCGNPPEAICLRPSTVCCALNDEGTYSICNPGETCQYDHGAVWCE